MDMVDMDMVDMDMGDMELGDMDIVDQRNVMQPNLSHSWIQWTTGHGHSGPRKQSISMVHYWVRHAKCTWSSYMRFQIFSSPWSPQLFELLSCLVPHQIFYFLSP